MTEGRRRRCHRVTSSTRPSGAATHATIEWGQIDWHQHEQNVTRLQARIVKAEKEGRRGKVNALQRLLTHSFSGKVLAVRRVTTNRGKRTPGVDGETWTTPAQKEKAVHQLRRHGYRPQPLRRVYIDKPGTTQKRPLGIPTVPAYCDIAQPVV
jgi:RNA-directed DNA polymerase